MSMVTILIPMAGKGQRFADAGYKEPKPLIDVCGKPMIHRVIDNLSPRVNQHRFYFITREEHGITDLPGLALDHDTEGAICTVLEAEYLLGPNPLVIANCDQLIVDFSMDYFLQYMQDFDCGTVTFNSTNPHHSYARTEKGHVVEVKEKEVISDNALAGIYYFKSGTEFAKMAKRMVKKDIRYNGEFYISPVFNEYIAAKMSVGMYEVEVKKKHMLGTPYELQIFLDKVKDGQVEL